MRATRTLVRLHILQGYLVKARGMLRELERHSGPQQDLWDLWEREAFRVRAEARIAALKRLLRRVRKRRSSRAAERGLH